MLFSIFFNCRVVFGTAFSRTPLTRLDKDLPELLLDGFDKELGELVHDELVDGRGQLARLAVLCQYLSYLLFAIWTYLGLHTLLTVLLVLLSTLLLLSLLLLLLALAFPTFVFSAAPGSRFILLCILLLFLGYEFLRAEASFDTPNCFLLRPLNKAF